MKLQHILLYVNAFWPMKGQQLPGHLKQFTGSWTSRTAATETMKLFRWRLTASRASRKANRKEKERAARMAKMERAKAGWKGDGKSKGKGYGYNYGYDVNKGKRQETMGRHLERKARASFHMTLANYVEPVGIGARSVLSGR